MVVDTYAGANEEREVQFVLLEQAPAHVREEGEHELTVDTSDTLLNVGCKVTSFQRLDYAARCASFTIIATRNRVGL